jgi:dipeptidyl-peptidase-4
VTTVAARRTLLSTLAQAAVLAGLALHPATAQQPDPARLTVERIFGSTEFTPETFGPSKWLGDGAAYTTLEAPPNGGAGREIVRYDSRTGARQVLISAAQLTPTGASEPLTVADYAWSDDQHRLLIFTNTRQVWRVHSRGDYWVLDRASGRLHKLGGRAADEASLMFAKFSPDGRRVGFVRENNIYVEHLESGAITQVTEDGSRTTINGTFDWVYEEELGLRDGWRWSPDGTWIAYWQLDAIGVRDFNLIRNNDSLYSQVVPIQYPKAGEQNSAARIGVVRSTGGTTTWLDFQGDPREHYPARMDWAANSSELIVQRLNRLQNALEVVLGDIRTGAITPLFTERDSAWVYHVDDLVWLNGGGEFTWVSERDGWSKVYVVSRDGRQVRLVTPGAYDVLGIQAIDAHGGWVYYIASPGAPAQRYLYRARLDGRGQPERLTPAAQAGTNAYDISPDGRTAIHTHSRFGVPPVINLVSLPDHRVLRRLVDNAALHAAVGRLDRGPWEFTTVDIGDGVELEAWFMKPVGFDPARRYPIVFHVYGGPGSQRVLDRWDGAGWLWHLMLAQQGYVVATIDNRGTGARGREWRKIVYGRLGVIETEDQIAAARVVGKYPWVDETRMGIWGWSYGGFMSLNGLFQGPDVYAAAISVAPVTHWKFYDTIYTERYNGLPQLNPAGYDAGSPLTHVAGMRGKLLLIHGTGDDNVHHQNTEALVNALVAGNKQFTMMAYPDRNHSISGGATSVHLRTLMTDFLNSQLRGAPAIMTP